VILYAVLAGFLLAPLAPLLRQVFGHRAGWLVGLLPAGLTAYFASFLPTVSSGIPIRQSDAWVPSLGIELSFYLDGLSLLFALLICGIGTFILIYAGGYLKGHKDQGRFLSFLLMFMGSMLGLVLADNVITLFVFWELTSVTSFLLIGFDHQRREARRAAVQALVVTGGGGLALLAGLILMAQVGGSLELSSLLAQGDLFRESPEYVAILILVLAGAFTKSAQVPFHFWLPNAMQAPTPVSAYLHSATMVKAGVYLLARLNPALGDTVLWETILPAFGGVTLLVGAYLALVNSDLKYMLAYTTLASLGLLVMLIGLGSEKALEAAVLYLIAHSLFKGGLFMVAGAVDHEAGTREIGSLGGLGRLMPITAAAAALHALSMSGMIPFFGFIAKEVIYKATIDLPSAELSTAVAVLGNALMIGVAALIAIVPFWGAAKETPKHAHEAPPSLWLGPIVLALTSLVIGSYLAWPEVNLVAPAVASLAGAPVEVNLYLWAGVNLPLMLSIGTIALGLFFFAVAGPMRRLCLATFGRLPGPDRGYDAFLDLLVGFSRAIMSLLQSGNLRHYSLVVFAAAAAVLWLPNLVNGPLTISFALPSEARFFTYIVILMAMAVVGALAVVLLRSRLKAIASMGVLGYAVAFIFLIFGAPDLAFTQLMVETLSVVILTLIILKLPVDAYDRRPLGPGIFMHLGVALAVGSAFTVLLLDVTQRSLDLSLSAFFEKASYPEAYGRNIVNVILVDFRALDTMGEIGVVVIAGVAALALILSRRRIVRISGASS